MEKWVEVPKHVNTESIAQKHGISPIVAEILLNRDIEESEMDAFLSPGPKSFHDPFMLNGMERVVCLLKEKISASEKIRIIGDYDVDGICATYILFRGLSFFGADADYDIPHRIEDGYGINEKLIRAAKSSGRSVIITCDNGISAADEVDLAHELNMTVIVTDHHEPPYEEVDGVKNYKLPKADALTDPKIPDDEYPFKGICGAFLALKVIEAYAKRFKVPVSEEFRELILELTEFAALATVCDVMELRDENRTLVTMGMRYMERSRNLGLKALINETGLSGKKISPYHLGFVIGPCLNASGRLDTSLRALSLFVERNPQSAKEKAADLKALNESRKAMTLEWSEKAFKEVESCENPDRVLVLYLKGCHESLAGIIAGKVRERFVRPTFVLTDAENGLKGSGRSIEAYDMHAGLVKADPLLTKYGGHRLAAGVSLEPEKLEAFIKNLNENCNLTEEDFSETVYIDAVLEPENATMALAREIDRLSPYGVGNETPLFLAKDLTIVSGSRMGKNANVGKYKVVSQNGSVCEMIYFGDLDVFEDYVSKKYSKETGEKLHSGQNISVKLDLCFNLGINTYMGRDKVQLTIKHFR